MSNAQAVELFRRQMEPGEKMLRFRSPQQLDTWLAADPRRRSACRHTVLAPSGIYLILRPLPPLATGARPATRRSRPESVRGWAVAAVVVPLLAVLGLLAWQPVWTIGAIVAMLAAGIWLARRGGPGNVVVRVFTSVSVKR